MHHYLQQSVKYYILVIHIMSEDTVPKKSDDSDLNIDFIKINIQINKK